MKKISGKIIVNGLGFGKITKIKPLAYDVKQSKLTDDNLAAEISKAETIFMEAVENLQEEIKEKAQVLNEETRAILEGHVILIEDGELTDRIVEIMVAERLDFITSCIMARDEYMQMFLSMSDPYLQERSSDIKDICNRFIKTYQHQDANYLTGIVCSQEITPSDILDFEPRQVQGIITENNTPNCHAAILARTLGIPFITGFEDICDIVVDNDMAIVDAFNNLLIVNPEDEDLNNFHVRYDKYLKDIAELRRYVGMPCIFADDQPFVVGVNINNQIDVEIATDIKAKSVGLFRSEYLYMGLKDFPSEDYLYDKYLEMTKSIPGEITIRTLDIGGDKSLDYFQIPRESNPYLGYRAIRYCLDHPDVLITQLKAILRLSANKQVKIMIPMITALDEVLAVKEFLKQAKNQLTSMNIGFDEDIELGIMIETPASVMISDLLARELDFFSIGTNDLLQYAMAADRNNQLVGRNYNPYSKAFLRMIRMTVDNATKEGIPVSVCGELAANPDFIPLLVGMGVSKLSVAPSQLLKVKKYLASTTYETCKEILEKSLKADRESEIEKLTTREDE